MPQLEWKKLLNNQRFSHLEPKKQDGKDDTPAWFLKESRTQAERDYDRILFATPTRRLADKTQVFPLEKNVSIRTRLTHSHEVSNLARSIGIYLASNFAPIKNASGEEGKRDVPAMLAAIGLAHDIGNPPFGHQGEKTIADWFRRKEKQKIFQNYDNKELTESQKQDFRLFEGNAQTLRVLTKLQVVDNQFGTNLTFGTLAALMKYPIPSDKADDKSDKVAYKKHGFFQSEKSKVETIWEQTGLSEGKRHPLTYIMEACDDIAYSILDAEDSVKKGLVSFSDLIAWLENKIDGSDEAASWVIKQSKKDHQNHRSQELSPSELNDVSMQKFRVHAIQTMISAVVHAFEENYNDIMTGEWPYPLMEKSKAFLLCKAVKKFDFLHGYKHRGVLEIELEGFNVLHDLMDMLWKGIIEREKIDELDSDRTSPFATYAYYRISENYRKQFEGKLPCVPNTELPIRYRELQLLTDMVSGMADGYAIEMWRDLRKFHVGASANEL